MWKKLRTAVAPSVVVVLAAYGMAYAATGTPNPIDLMSNHSRADQHAHVSPKPSHSPDTSDDPADGDAPEPSHTPKASHGPVRSTVGCPDGFTGNHGQFVSKSDDHHAAAKSDCGKPVHSESPEVSSSDHGDDHGEHVGQNEHSPEPSESPDPDSTGDQHSNDHTGSGGDSSSSD
jgi:hypothetical protein